MSSNDEKTSDLIKAIKVAPKGKTIASLSGKAIKPQDYVPIPVLLGVCACGDLLPIPKDLKWFQE